MEYKTDKLRPTQPFLVLETQDFKQEIYLNQGISHFYTFRLEKTKEITTVPDSCVDMLFEYGENGMTACTSQQKVDTTLYFYTSFNEHNTPYTVLESDNSESMPDVLH